MIGERLPRACALWAVILHRFAASGIVTTGAVRQLELMETDKSLRKHLIELLDGGHAHASFDDVIADFPPKLRGEKPAGLVAWDKSVRSFHRDLGAMRKLVNDAKTDLFAKIPWGEGQTILREAMLVADHNSHHLGQLIDVRRLLGIWK